MMFCSVCLKCWSMVCVWLIGQWVRLWLRLMIRLLVVGMIYRFSGQLECFCELSSDVCRLFDVGLVLLLLLVIGQFLKISSDLNSGVFVWMFDRVWMCDSGRNVCLLCCICCVWYLCSRLLMCVFVVSWNCVGMVLMNMFMDVLILVIFGGCLVLVILNIMLWWLLQWDIICVQVSCSMLFWVVFWWCVSVLIVVCSVGDMIRCWYVLFSFLLVVFCRIVVVWLKLFRWLCQQCFVVFIGCLVSYWMQLWNGLLGIFGIVLVWLFVVCVYVVCICFSSSGMDYLFNSV